MWGKPDAGDRIAQVLVWLAALVALANAAFMLADPLRWYDWVGTVKATGPANGHFIRDIGLAYLLSGGLLAYAGINLPMRWSAALTGAGWLALHGALHVWEVSLGLCAPGIFWREAPGTLGPPLLALAGIAIMLVRQRISAAPLPNALFLPLADRLTMKLSPHLPDIARAPGRLLEKYRHFMPLNVHAHAASAGQLAMARIGAVMAEDCGPCVLIAAHGALRDGVPRASVNAALRGDPPPGELAEAFHFGRALVRHAPELDELAEAIEARHGRAVRTELTFAAACARLHPTLKRGLGFARSCSVTPLEV